ncbi:MAG: hypothetical protein ACE5J9_08305 [Methanosarcinales archaeon]
MELSLFQILPKYYILYKVIKALEVATDALTSAFHCWIAIGTFIFLHAPSC